MGAEAVKSVQQHASVPCSTGSGQVHVRDPSQSVVANEVTIGELKYEIRSSVNERSEILKWLNIFSSLPFSQRHKDYRQVASKASGTGTWIFKSEEFIGWKQGLLPRLWCHGIPGAGKTILASIVIEQLRQEYVANGDGSLCIYVYFDYQDVEHQHTSSLLTRLFANMLAQVIAACQEHLPDRILRMHEEYTTQKTMPDSQDFLELLIQEFGNFNRVFIVIDALDECPNYPGVNTRDEFVDAICQLPITVDVMFFSRTDTTIGAQVNPSAELQISARKDDLKLYINSRINTCGSFRKVVEMNQEECSSRIIETVTKSAQGMFLLAHLHMEELVREITTNGLQHKLNNLPKTTDKIYEAALTRIKAQEARKRELAMDLLSYILYAARPLTVHELSHAFAIQNGSRKLEDIHGDILADGYLTSTCAGIVIVDTETSIVRLVHHTAQKYFQDHMDKDQVFHKVSLSLAEKCLIYLSFAEFSQILSADELQHRRAQYPFLNYAADNWHIHLAETPVGNRDHLALKFLECASKVSSAVQAMSDSRMSSQKRVTGLHLATYCNATSSVNLLLSKPNGIDAKTQHGETAMHWAIDYNRVDILKALIQKGADINATDKNGRTVLHRAAACGKVNLAKILVEAKQINLNPLDFQNYTPLRTAAHRGHGSMVRLLVDHGADLDIRDEHGWAALRDAALREHHLTVKYLIEQGANCQVQATKGHYWSVLCWAATQGHISVVRLLIEKGANLNVTTDEGKSALRCAMEYGYGKVVWLLVKAGRNIDLNLPDHDGWSPLHAAVKRSLVRDASFLWLLLENGADVNAQTKRGLTALHIAAEEDDVPIAWVLLEKGVKIDVKNKGGMTALHIASRRGNDKFVRFLLEMGADPMAVDASEKTALHWAITELVEGSTHHHKVTKRLIEWMANTAIQDEEGLSALHIIASEGSLSPQDRVPYARMLLERGCSPDIEGSNENQTPLQRAVRKRHHELVHVMMTAGADVNKQDEDGWSVLHLAAVAGDQEMIDILLQSRTGDLSVRNNSGLTPNQLAEQLGHKDLHWE